MALAISTCLAATSPLLLPIRSNPVSLSGTGSVRGIPVSLGNPSQFFSMKPAVNQNNTFVYNHCNPSNYTCIAEHGGVYTAPANVVATNSYNSWNGTIGGDILNGTYVYFNDLMTIEGHQIPGFPFFTYQQSADSISVQPGLGLGPNSTFLRAALDLNIVPSHKWSYWAGDTAADVDGHLLIGGYDSNRVDGGFETFNIHPKLNLLVNITDVSWVSSSSNRTSLMAGTGFDILFATIEPFAEYINLPVSVRENFETATDAYIDNETRLLAYNSLPSGTLEITLLSGQVVSLPAQDLFDHGLSYDSEGNANTSTYNFWTPKVWRETEYPDFTLTLGAPFLARMYLITDFYAGQYHLANAVQGAGSAVNIKPLCTGGPSTPPPTPPTPGPGDKKSNVGAIAGGVAGGVGGLILIGGIIFLVMRKRRQNKRVGPNDDPNVNTMTQPHSPHPPPRYISGVPQSVQVFAEKDGSSAATHEISHSGKVDAAGPDGIGELPSPRSEVWSDVSRSSQSYLHSPDKVPQALVEMPTERY